jgi:hypothetical protein
MSELLVIVEEFPGTVDLVTVALEVFEESDRVLQEFTGAKAVKPDDARVVGIDPTE